MLGIEGQLVLNIAIGENDTFIEDIDQVIELTLIEEAGNVLPTFIFTFISHDETLLASLHEGSEIKVQMGKTLENMDDYTMYVSKMTSDKEGNDQRAYLLKGFVGNINYITDHKYLLSDKKSGIEVALEVAKANFGSVVSNITKSKDKQVWIQPTTTDKKFVQDCILHSDLGNSFPIFGIASDGTFILKDVLKDSNRPSPGYDWRFTDETIDIENHDETDIVYDGDVSLSSRAGFINNWMGYQKTVNIVNPTTGVEEDYFATAEPVLALTNALAKAHDIEKRFIGTQLVNDNVHPTYQKAYMNNLAKLANLGKLGIPLSFQNEYHGIRILDLCMFTQRANEGTAAGEYQSGLYYATKVSKSLQEGSYVTTVFINRESLNQIEEGA